VVKHAARVTKEEILATRSARTKSRRSFCVFTTLFGNYEPLNEQAVAMRSSIPFICLTDDPNLRSDSWEVRLLTTLFGMDPIRSQRALKLLPFDYLPEFDCSLYIDNTVCLTEPPERLVAQFNPEGGIAFQSIASVKVCWTR